MTDRRTGSAGAGRECIVCYVTDIDFAFPTMVSAVGLRRWISPQMADVFILTIDIEERTFERLRQYGAEQSIHVLPFDSKKITGFNAEKFNKTHVPKSTLGRLFIMDYIADSYSRLIYLDGDTWFAKDPSALISYQPPPGRIAAAEDPIYFFQNTLGRTGQTTRAYLAGLGIDGQKGYFNAGVMIADLKTWKTLTEEAFEFFLRHTDKCSYHDQSALNAVAQDRRERLSPRWNFATAYRYWGVEQDIKPKIYHFVGGHKPWTGRFAPWVEICDAYRRLTVDMSELDLPIHRLSAEKQAEIDRQAKLYALKLRLAMMPRRLIYRSKLIGTHSASIALEA